MHQTWRCVQLNSFRGGEVIYMAETLTEEIQYRYQLPWRRENGLGKEQQLPPLPFGLTLSIDKDLSAFKECFLILARKIGAWRIDLTAV